MIASLLSLSVVLRAAPRATAPSMVAGATSAAPFDKDAFNSVVQTTYGRFDFVVARGRGCYLWNAEGERYLDFAAGISTCCLGHANENLALAVSKQMRSVHHVSNLYYIPQQGALAKKLVDSSCADRAFFCNSGAEANEAAIKLARKHARTKLGAKGTPVIITALNSFHGRTLAAITATGQPKYQENFGPLPGGFEYTPYNDIDALKALVKKINGGLNPFRRRSLAAIMLEPLQGEGGIIPATKAYMEAARELCDATGALLICDEVQTGMGRTGQMWGHQVLGVEPDVFTTAKALGGGVPIGAMLCKSNADVFAPGDHASTYGGNPLACAAGLAVFDSLERDDLLENVKARGAELVEALGGVKERLGVIKEVRGWGLILGIELTDDCGFTAAQLCAAATKEGLLTVPAGVKVLRLVPPLIVSAAEAAEAVTKLEAAMAACIADAK